MKLYTKNKEKLHSIGFFNTIVYKLTPNVIGPDVYIIASFFPYVVKPISFSLASSLLRENKKISYDLDIAIKFINLKQ